MKTRRAVCLAALLLGVWAGAPAATGSPGEIGETGAELAVKYFTRVDLFDPADAENAKDRRVLSGGGATESDILDHFLSRHFDRPPQWSGPLTEYRYGAYRVVTRSRAGVTVSVRIEEPVTGFSILMEYNDGLLVRKTHSYQDEILDRVDYAYRDGRMIRARSRLYGTRVYR